MSTISLYTHSLTLSLSHTHTHTHTHKHTHTHTHSADKGVGIGPIANVLRSMVEKLKETEVIEAAAAAEAAAAKRLLEKDQKKANTRIRRPKIDKSTTTSTIDIKDVQKAEIVETYEL